MHQTLENKKKNMRIKMKIPDASALFLLLYVRLYALLQTIGFYQSLILVCYHYFYCLTLLVHDIGCRITSHSSQYAIFNIQPGIFD